MAGFASWFGASQYGNWNRTLRIHQTPYLARTDTNISRQATTMAQEAVSINMGNTMSESNATSASKKAAGALFGPNIGIVARGPEWTERNEKAIDELTPETVRNWWSKSKQNQATTTLQALVNLKRPSLRLVPLEISSSDDPNHVDSQHHHGLEFEYDCDAPKCSITVHVVISPRHRFADKGTGSSNSKILVYENTTDGGFGKVLRLEEGAMLELGKFEHQLHVPKAPEDSKNEKAEVSTSEIAGQAESPLGTPAPEERPERKSRLLNFHLRRRNQERHIAGPAIAVLDSDADKEEDKVEKQDEDNLGVRATIRLSALDSNGKPFPCPNEQTTYLHILRFGAPPPAEEEDKRPWVVKVVKREATIGAHTFQLHEIYGLSSNTSNSIPPPQPPPTTYPPQAATPAYDDEPSSECLLCLSSPREVVLLPCRHLVACRDCAINMIEFGAGGQIQQPTEAPETPAAEGDNVETPQGEGATPVDGTTPAAPVTPATAAPLITPTTNTRRKRKAKGWFCPVCRQPYTACLRITTTPPAKGGDETDEQESVDIGDHPLSDTGASIAEPPPAAVTSRTGGLASLVRPGFLRSIPRQPVPDPERGQATSAA